MEDTLFRGNREPTLDQILAEPIVQTMMRRDAVDDGHNPLPDAHDCLFGNTTETLKFQTIAPRPRVEGDTSQASIGVLAKPPHRVSRGFSAPLKGSAALFSAAQRLRAS
jgi:hypothetical protein